MLATLLRFGATVAAIFLCDRFMDGVHILDPNNAILLGVVLAILYTLLRPFLRFVLKLPNFCTLGLVYVLLDAMLVNWVPKIVRNSVEIDSFWWALAVSLAVNALRLLVDMFFDKDKDRERERRGD
ncbi:MAG: phage holin family protein [Clostridia bacterium]|nr:phage holin family protein [Clostridia bacterium]